MVAIDQSMLQEVVAIAKLAGAEILKIYQQKDDVNIKIKGDNSPVTEADLKAHQVIVEQLQQLTPEWPILSEEAADIPYETRRSWQYYWLVDPLDGTKEFIHGNDEFTVNIALIYQGQPILGVVYVPCADTTYYALNLEGAFKQVANDQPSAIHCSAEPQNPMRIVSSRHHKQPKLQQIFSAVGAYKLAVHGSALKFCVVAEGKADFYPRPGPTSEWDTAAAQCIVEQAGGVVCNEQGEPFRYNQKSSLLNPSFFASGSRQQSWVDFFSNLIIGDK